MNFSICTLVRRKKFVSFNKTVIGQKTVFSRIFYKKQVRHRPVIFTLYIAVREYNLTLYGYADDHKIAFRIQAGNAQNEATFIQQLNECLKEIIQWMTKYKLKMNNSKTDIVLYGTKQ